MPASLNCQYSNIRNVEFLYSSNVANPCSVDNNNAIVDCFVWEFSYDDMKCQLKPIPVSMTDEELSLPWQQKNGMFVVLCLYLTTSEFQTECLASRKCEHWHENH